MIKVNFCNKVFVILNENYSINDLNLKIDCNRNEKVLVANLIEVSFMIEQTNLDLELDIDKDLNFEVEVLSLVYGLCYNFDRKSVNWKRFC